MSCRKTANTHIFPMLPIPLHRPIGDVDMLRNLGENGVSQGKFNISFLSMFLLGDLEKCLEILIQTNRIPEAAFFARFVDTLSYSTRSSLIN